MGYGEMIWNEAERHGRELGVRQGEKRGRELEKQGILMESVRAYSEQGMSKSLMITFLKGVFKLTDAQAEEAIDSYKAQGISQKA